MARVYPTRSQADRQMLGVAVEGPVASEEKPLIAGGAEARGWQDLDGTIMCEPLEVVQDAWWISIFMMVLFCAGSFIYSTWFFLRVVVDLIINQYIAHLVKLATALGIDVDSETTEVFQRVLPIMFIMLIAPRVQTTVEQAPAVQTETATQGPVQIVQYQQRYWCELVFTTGLLLIIVPVPWLAAVLNAPLHQVAHCVDALKEKCLSVLHMQSNEAIDHVMENEKEILLLTIPIFLFFLLYHYNRLRDLLASFAVLNTTLAVPFWVLDNHFHRFNDTHHGRHELILDMLRDAQTQQAPVALFVIISLVFLPMPIAVYLGGTSFRFFKIIAEWAQFSASQGRPLLLAPIWWHYVLVDIVAFLNNGRDLLALFNWEWRAFGKCEYWWHGEALWCWSHKTVDKLCRDKQRREPAFGGIHASVPDLFPSKALMFLTNGGVDPYSRDTEWWAIRQALHKCFLNIGSAEYQERINNLPEVVKKDNMLKDWKAKSGRLSSLNDPTFVAKIVARCLIYVLFGDKVIDPSERGAKRRAMDIEAWAEAQEERRQRWLSMGGDVAAAQRFWDMHTPEERAGFLEEGYSYEGGLVEVSGKEILSRKWLLTEEDEERLAEWSTLESSFVLPRLVHRILCGYGI
jgi:hypothetical protein